MGSLEDYISSLSPFITAEDVRAIERRWEDIEWLAGWHSAWVAEGAMYLKSAKREISHAERCVDRASALQARMEEILLEKRGEQLRTVGSAEVYSAEE